MKQGLTTIDSMNSKLLIKMLLVFGLFPSTSFGVAALWGDIDEPVEDVLQQQAVSATPEPLPQKTTCEVLLQQADLGADFVGSAKMQDQLKLISNSSRPEYRMLFTKPDYMKNLYRQFREQYIQLNCKK